MNKKLSRKYNKSKKRTNKTPRKTKKNRKSRKNKIKQKGGNSIPKKWGYFIPFKNIIDDKCSICQEDLKNEKIISYKGIVYELACGHQFHNNCLNGWCDINKKKSNSYYEKDTDQEAYLRPPTKFRCPICNQTTLSEEYDCVSTETLYPITKMNKEYASKKYTGIKQKKELTHLLKYEK